MEGNRDESDICLQRAETFRKNGEFEQALKYANKAERLFPSERAKELLSFINSSKESAKEQHEAVQTILKCKDNYYEVLGVTKLCTVDELQKAYKKLALKVHPDKNHAPGAKEAFNAIKNAYDTLTDRELRQRYNDSEDERYGTQMPQSTTQMPQHETRMPQPTNYSRTSSQFYHRRADENPLLLLIYSVVTVAAAVVGVTLALPVWLLKSFLEWYKIRQAYSLQQNSQYVTRRTTKIWSVPYFVKTDFLSYNADDIAQIEEQVEEEFLNSQLKDFSTRFAR